MHLQYIVVTPIGWMSQNGGCGIEAPLRFQTPGLCFCPAVVSRPGQNSQSLCLLASVVSFLGRFGTRCLAAELSHYGFLDPV